MLSSQILQSGFLNPQSLIDAAGPWALVVVCGVIFAETGLLIGFFLPGDTLLFFTGVLAFTGHLQQPLWLIVVAIGVAAIVGAETGYLIGRRVGPTIFERRESGVFSRASLERAQRFFDRFGSASILLARFIPVVRTFIPVAAGVAGMRRVTFTIFNVLGAFAWSTAVTCAGYLLGQIPGVSGFVSQYIDIVLAGIVVCSVTPVIIRAIRLRDRRRMASAESRPSDHSEN
ncbi:MAG: DedA family protein [Microbacteriaceae bacterium]|nr:MAG: DedA family protein [Microbacteriaceae bacterium]